LRLLTPFRTQQSKGIADSFGIFADGSQQPGSANAGGVGDKVQEPKPSGSGSTSAAFYTACVVRMFKWATAEQMVSPSVLSGLQTLERLKKGKSGD